MSGLSTLKFVNSKRLQGISPQQARRQKLCTKLDEQIQLAKAQQSGEKFSPTKARTVKDEATGDIRKVEVPKKLKPWWWTDDKGKLCITVRYGARTMEIVEGKNAIETDSIAGVITSLQVIRTAVESGELDNRIEAATNRTSSDVSIASQQGKRLILRLPTKANQ